MSARISLFCISLFLVFSVHAAGESGAVAPTDARPASSQPARAATPAASGSASTQPMVDGTVTRALMRLYRIPRSPSNAGAAENAGAARPGVDPHMINRTPRARAGTGTHSDPSKGNNTTGGATRQSTNEPRMGTQHSDAIRESVSSVPIGDDLRQPAGDGHIVENPNHGPVVARQESLTAERWSPTVDYPGDDAAYTPGDYYRFGFYDRRGTYDRSRFRAEGEARRQSVLSHAGTQMSRGLAAFRAGQYRTAVKYFKLTADTNQGDPASRIYAAHALFAIGRYAEAVEYLRRALSLEPRIAMLTYDVRDDYGRKTDFDTQLTDLQRAVQAAPADLNRLILLGYVLNYTDQPDGAYEALAKARKLNARDKLVQVLYDGTNPPDIAAEKGTGAGKQP